MVTNAHVVWPFEEVRIVFPDGSEDLAAPVLAMDLIGDLAVIGPLNVDIEPLILEDGEDVVIGSDLLLIGYPAETEQFPQPTITRGILSRLRDWEPIEMTYFQTDAAIAGGQSGGVLVSAAGEVIGVSGFSLSEAGFGLVASASDILPRVKDMISGRDVAGLGNRSVPLQGGKLKHVFNLPNYWDGGVFVINEPSGTSIDISVESEEDAAFFLSDQLGNTLLEIDQGFTGPESGSARTSLDLPHFLTVFHVRDSTGEFQVESNVKLAPLVDVDDGENLNVGQTILAALDYPGDNDFFTIDLEEGETVEIVADSMNLDPYLIVDFQGAAQNRVAFDDDSGGGIFGLNALLIYRAPHNGSFRIVVSDANGALGGTGGYFVIVSEAAPGAIPATIAAPPTTVKTPFGPMAVYESAQLPISIQYPASWTEQPQEAPDLRNFLDEAGIQQFGVAEENLTALGLGELNLQEYTDVILEVIGSTVAGFEVLSRTGSVTRQGMPAEILEFEILGGVLRAKRLIVLVDGQNGFSATYVVSASDYAQLEPLMDYSFGTFRVEQAGPVPTPTPTPLSTTTLTPTPTSAPDSVTAQAAYAEGVAFYNEG